MGWTKLDTVIERTRDRVTEDPAAAREGITELLSTTGSPSGRVRLWALMMLACRRVGDLEAAFEAYRTARRIRRACDFARADLEEQATLLHIVSGDLDAARAAIGKAIALIRPLAENPRGASKGARRMARRDRAKYAATLIVRGEVARNLEGDAASLRRALADALEALRWVDPRHAMRVHLSAVSLLCTVMAKAGTPEDAAYALRLVDESDKLLRKRRISSRHLHRIILRWIRALAIARLGASEQAERILTEVVRSLQQLGLDDDADRAGADLVWVIGERAGKLGVARYLRRQMGLPCEETPPETEPDDPIGF